MNLYPTGIGYIYNSDSTSSPAAVHMVGPCESDTHHTTLDQGHFRFVVNLRFPALHVREPWPLVSVMTHNKVQYIMMRMSRLQAFNMMMDGNVG